jgi:hypothetical protein
MASVIHRSAVRVQQPSAPPAATPRATTVSVQAPDAATLQSQLSDLRVQLTGLQAKWDGLYSQLNVMLQNNPARPRVQQAWADVGVDIARVKGDIALREAQLARLQGRPVGTTQTAPPGRFPIQSIDSDLLILSSVGVLLALGLPVSIAWAKRLLRRRPEPAPTPSDIAPRLESIERAVDAIAIEIERISEGQRFVTKIFVDRPAQGAPPESNAPSAAKALGAGPIQPMDVPERQRAPQRIITPH